MTVRDSNKKQAGFTLLELLVVGVIVLVFVAVMLILLRPMNTDAQRRNIERRLELAQIMQAIAAYKKQTGSLPPSLTEYEVSVDNTEAGIPTLCNDLVPNYLDDLPYDPVTSIRFDEKQACSADNQVFVTGYTAQVEHGNVILTAPSAENEESIVIERQFPLFQ